MKLFPFILVICASLGYGQEFTPLDTTSYKKRMVLKSDFETRFKTYNKTISNEYKGKLKKELLVLLEAQQNEILDVFTDNDLLIDNSFTKFLEASLDSVKNNHPEIKSNYTILLSKSPTPNAYSVGYDIIIVNIGLFKYLKNQKQVQAVLLHELAHAIKKHSISNTVEKAKANISSKTKKDLKSLNAIKYNKGNLAFKKLKEVLMKKSLKSQRQELEADSLGFILFSNTWQQQSAFINTLRSLQEMNDAPYYKLDTTIYRRLFNLKDLPFKEDWLKKEDFSAYNYKLYNEKIDIDSIKSHPELNQRIDYLKLNLSEDNNYEYLKPSKAFLQLKHNATLQQVANLFDIKEYGASLYSTLILLETYPKMPYLLRYVGLNFDKIHDAQKNYKLNRYVEQLNPNEQSESYNLFLNFIWNLRLNEMKIIADYYTSKHP